MYPINNQKQFINRLMPSNKITCEKEVIYQNSCFRDLLKKKYIIPFDLYILVNNFWN